MNDRSHIKLLPQETWGSGYISAYISLTSSHLESFMESEVPHLRLFLITMHLIVLAAGLGWGRRSHRLHGCGVMT